MDERTLKDDAQGLEIRFAPQWLHTVQASGFFQRKAVCVRRWTWPVGSRQGAPPALAGLAPSWVTLDADDDPFRPALTGASR
jgi:hypothetical protein